jgi:hypothetical protein
VAQQLEDAAGAGFAGHREAPENGSAYEHGARAERQGFEHVGAAAVSARDD